MLLCWTRLWLTFIGSFNHNLLFSSTKITIFLFCSPADHSFKRFYWSSLFGSKSDKTMWTHTLSNQQQIFIHNFVSEECWFIVFGFHTSPSILAWTRILVHANTKLCFLIFQQQRINKQAFFRRLTFIVDSTIILCCAIMCDKKVTCSSACCGDCCLTTCPFEDSPLPHHHKDALFGVTLGLFVCNPHWRAGRSTPRSDWDKEIFTKSVEGIVGSFWSIKPNQQCLFLTLRWS